VRNTDNGIRVYVAGLVSNLNAITAIGNRCMHESRIAVQVFKATFEPELKAIREELDRIRTKGVRPCRHLKS